MGEEVPSLLAAAEAEGVRVLWVSLSPCLVEHTPIHAYQAVLPIDHYLEELSQPQQQRALKTIAETIRDALAADLPKPRPQPAAPGTSASPPVAAAAAPATTPPGPAERNPGARQPLAGRRVESARLVRSGGGWQVERREVEVRGCLVELGDGVSLPLIEVPAGELVMGSPEDEPLRGSDEGPMHRVRLEGFLIGQTPITQAQWRAVARQVPPLGQRWERELALNPSNFTGQADSDQRPVEQVSWHDAMEFCRRLSALSGDAYKLPSEAQWEYACRAGSTTPFAFGETITPELANYRGTSSYANGPKGEYRQQTTPVGMFAANAWGLQDMHGNVWEWCLDHWHDSYEGAPFDGSAWVSGGGQSRLLRGGSWHDLPGGCRSAYRALDRPDYANDDVGFRVVCLPQGPSLNP
jgi:formylglycine-generating enzyme required for sulfatase activity